MLEEFEPVAFQALLDTIKQANKATPQMLRKGRTLAPYWDLAIAVRAEMKVHPELS
jgi:hypothetical protein